MITSPPTALPHKPFAARLPIVRPTNQKQKGIRSDGPSPPQKHSMAALVLPFTRRVSRPLAGLSERTRVIRSPLVCPPLPSPTPPLSFPLSTYLHSRPHRPLFDLYLFDLDVKTRPDLAEMGKKSLASHPQSLWEKVPGANPFPRLLPLPGCVRSAGGLKTSFFFLGFFGYLGFSSGWVFAFRRVFSLAVLIILFPFTSNTTLFFKPVVPNFPPNLPPKTPGAKTSHPTEPPPKKNTSPLSPRRCDRPRSPGGYSGRGSGPDPDLGSSLGIESFKGMSREGFLLDDFDYR